jgi:hypothetical protein
MKKLKHITLFALFLSFSVFSQDLKQKKQDLYIVFTNNINNTYFNNDTVVARNFRLDFGKFIEGKDIRLKVDKKNNLEKNTWIRGANSSAPPIINFYYWSNEINRDERIKVDIKEIKNLLEEDEIIKYVEFNNLKEILSKFNIYAVQKEGEEYFACKVQYAIW